MNKEEIDKEAEREAAAIRRLRDEDKPRMSSNYKRIRQQADHNKILFDRLFRS